MTASVVTVGTVTSGKLADLVVLTADPLADIANADKIDAVIANGRYFDRAQLDALIADVERQGRGRPEVPTPWPARSRPAYVFDILGMEPPTRCLPCAQR